LGGNGSFVYTPVENYTGVDVFTYVANDSFVDSNVATVNITVLPVSDAPIVNDDFYNTNEDTTLNVAAPGVLANDTDPDNDTISALLVLNPSNGTLSFNSNGSFVYSPDSDYYGSDNFTYKATDGVMVSNNATVFITIIAVNDPPIANDDFYSTQEDTPLNITAPGVLLNDTDIDNTTLTTEKVSDPAHGYLTFNSDGSFEYIPDAEYIGYDSFTYRSYDGINYSNNATVHIDITDVNDPPVANDDTAIVGENTVDNEINVLLNDFDNENDKLIITSVTQPDKGTAIYNNDYVYYTPDPGYTGPDQFEYYITDGNGGFDNAIVDITVIHINHPPTPPVVSGPPQGTPGLEYQYAFVSTDPDGDLISYEILWGDGTFEDWLGPYNSDQVISVSHSWSARGFYTIMARAKDTHGAVSEWGTLDVWMPRNKAVTNSFILRFLERLFYRFPLLRLLGLQFGIYSPKHLNISEYNSYMTGG
jgi:VCBS repeat-containing protein